MCSSRLVNGHHLDAVQIIRGQTQLTAQKAERTADDVTAHADAWILAERNRGAPFLEEPLKRFADRRARFDGHSAALGIVGDPFHRRDIHNHAHVGIGDESFQTVAATRHYEPSALVYGSLDGCSNLIG